MTIRHEKQGDYRIVEELTRRAFWNLHVPGCNEHYLVHKLRDHKDFIPELDFVLEIDNKVIGNIMYTKSKLLNTEQKEMDILTFGPVSIDPPYQRKGYGKRLIEHSLSAARAMGYDYVVIFGNPSNYVRLGFKSCVKYGIYIGAGIFPTAMLVKQIGNTSLASGKWQYLESDAYSIDDHEAEEFDKGFVEMRKEANEGQEEFFILSGSSLNASA